MLDRRIRRRAVLCIGIALSLQLPAVSAEPVAFEHARLLPIDAPPIDDGVLVVDDGRIVALGAADDVRIPSGARRIDLRGKQVMPGLVDTHSHVGIATRPLVGAHLDFNESSGPIQPALRALDAINPDDPAIRMAVAGGVTTANVMPGSGNIIGGQTAYVKLAGTRIEDMLIDGALGGLKMANGENAKNAYGSRGQKPVTRMAEASLAREQFIKAQEYRTARQRWNDEGRHKGEAAPARDLGMEALLDVLDGKRIVQHHSHRADDIASVLRLADEFGFRVVVHHGTEAYKLADVLAAKKIPVSLIVIDSPGGKHEAAEYRYDGAAQLERAGVLIAIHTDDFINSSRFLLREAALAVRGGLTRDTALAAVTLNAAKMLDLDGRLGSLTVGKDADFIVLSGDPLAAATFVEQTWIDGAQVYDRNDPQHRRYAVGGFAAAGDKAGEE